MAAGLSLILAGCSLGPHDRSRVGVDDGARTVTIDYAICAGSIASAARDALASGALERLESSSLWRRVSEAASRVGLLDEGAAPPDLSGLAALLERLPASATLHAVIELDGVPAAAVSLGTGGEQGSMAFAIGEAPDTAPPAGEGQWPLCP